MATVITLGLQKGGVAKSTTTGVLAHIYAEEGKKVLVVDMDMQGNVSELLSGSEANAFLGESVYEAMIDKEIRGKIREVRSNLHLLPSTNFLSLLSRWIYTGTYTNFQEEGRVTMYKRPTGSPFSHLDAILRQARPHYDIILIDTPPSLSEQTTNALYASDYVVSMFECSKFCHSAIENFLLTIDMAKKASPHKVELVGILRMINDARRTDAKEYRDMIAKEHPELVFETVVPRRATIGRLPLNGFSENRELYQAVEVFMPFYTELNARIAVSKESEKGMTASV